MSFIDFEVEADEQELIDRAFAAMETAFPGWVPHEANLETIVTEEWARMLVETARVAADVPTEVFRAFGTTVIGFPDDPANRAMGEVTIVAGDDTGYTIPVGTLLGYRFSGNELWGFRTTTEEVIAPGSTQVTGVAIEATEEGSLYNGVDAGESMEMIDALAFVSSVVVTTGTSGGKDQESAETYLNRLASRLTLLADRPILPDDFAALALWTAGVFRTRALDGYNPLDQSSDNERMVAVAALDSGGASVGSGVKDAIATHLESRRELGFIVNVIDPTFTIIDVVFVAQALPGHVPATVQEAAVAAVTNYLDPATWAGGSETPPVWRDEDVVRYLEVAAVLDRVKGLDIVTTLTLNGTSDDVDLAGVLGLPRKVEVGGSTVDGTVT